VAINIPIVSQYNAKGVNDANKSLGGFDKTVKNLGKSIAGVFAAQKVISFFASSVKGALDDQRAQVQLEKSIRNTTNATSAQIAGLNQFIQKTQFSTGVLDDQLRPALNRLVLATGDVEKSQKLVGLALDISAGTGKDLESVTTALSKAAGGQYTSLQRLGVGLSKATLETKDLDTITGVLSGKFSGQAAAAADTLSGKIQILRARFIDMQETIGFGLITAFDILSGSGGSVDDFGQAITDAGIDVANFIIGVADLTREMYDLTNSFIATAKSAGYLPESFSLKNLFALIPILPGIVGGFGLIAERGEKIAAVQKAIANGNPNLRNGYLGMTSTMKSYGDVVEETTNKTKGLSDAQKAVINANIKLQDSIVNNLQTSLSSAENSLSAVTNKFEDLNNTISSSVTDVIDFGKAIETENFIDAITKQAQDATSFADKVKQLIVMGLSERGIRELLDAGFDAGSLIADQLIAGGTTVVQQINTLLDSVNVVAETVGRLGAQTFYQQGVDQGNALVDGIKAALASAQSELDRLRESLTAPSKATGATAGAGGDTGATVIAPVIRTPAPKTVPGTSLTQAEVNRILADPVAQASAARYQAMANTRRFAKGGIVTGPTNALIGEAGPEAVIPLSGRNGGLGQTFNIVVNAGVGTNGAQVGAQIVEAIKKYERTSGQVFARA
jgi:uncharacterized coiled-coil protein SlyX